MSCRLGGGTTKLRNGWCHLISHITGRADYLKEDFLCATCSSEQIRDVFCDFILGHLLVIVRKDNAGSVNVLLFSFTVITLFSSW